jgi:hypothetical protein
MYEFLIDTPAIHVALFRWIFRNPDRATQLHRPSGYLDSRSRRSGGSSVTPGNRSIVNQFQRQIGSDINDSNSQVENHLIPSTTYEQDVIMDPNSEFWARLRDPAARRRDLALTYEMIYHPILSVLNAEETKTWMWLSVALLINIACIQIEIMLFQGIMEQEQQERGYNATTTTTTPLTTPGINRYLRG